MKQLKFDRVSVVVVSRRISKVKPIHNIQLHPTIHSTPNKNNSDDPETLPSTSISLPNDLFQQKQSLHGILSASNGDFKLLPKKTIVFHKEIWKREPWIMVIGILIAMFILIVVPVTIYAIHNAKANTAGTITSNTLLSLVLNLKSDALVIHNDDLP
ncbi:unnamed protein product [Rotaria sordida]|uniref:Uncharacterized protein n=1 Tax=Rotaria sordida TaxID=392033 RepID=A0A819XB14_9BILA|nr:unnamed protein product [Rotaria sordida]